MGGVVSRDDGRKCEGGAGDRRQGVSDREIRAHIRRQLKRLLERETRPKAGRE
jgi:predicted component of type VI protein secretion system